MGTFTEDEKFDKLTKQILDKLYEIQESLKEIEPLTECAKAHLNGQQSMLQRIIIFILLIQEFPNKYPIYGSNYDQHYKEGVPYKGVY